MTQRTIVRAELENITAICNVRELGRVVTYLKAKKGAPYKMFNCLCFKQSKLE